MKILNLENEENQELLQEIKNRVDKDKLCFQEKKVQAFQECFRPFLPSKHVYTPFPITDILSTILDKGHHAIWRHKTSAQDRITQSY